MPAVHGGATPAGVAFGAVSQGVRRALLASLHQEDRATPLAADYVLGYLSMNPSAIAAGAATQHFGLRTASHPYAVAAALPAVAAVAALTASRRTAFHTAHNHLR